MHKIWLQYKCAFKYKIIKYELSLKSDFFMGQAYKLTVHKADQVGCPSQKLTLDQFSTLAASQLINAEFWHYIVQRRQRSYSGNMELAKFSQE